MLPQHCLLALLQRLANVGGLWRTTEFVDEHLQQLLLLSLIDGAGRAASPHICQD